MEETSANASCPKTLFSKLCAHKQCSQCSCSCVETLVILRAKLHVVSSLLSVLKIAMLPLICPSTVYSHLKWVWPENENTMNLKSASFVVIMLLQEGLTHVHSPKKPRLHSGESFTLKGKAGNILRFSPLSTNAINRPKPISWLVFQHSPTSIPETVAFNNKSAGFHWRRTVKTSNLQTRLLFPGATTFTYDHVLCWYGKLVCKELLLYTSSIYRATLIYFATCFWPSAEWMSNITFFLNQHIWLFSYSSEHR